MYLILIYSGCVGAQYIYIGPPKRQHNNFELCKFLMKTKTDSLDVVSHFYSMKIYKYCQKMPCLQQQKRTIQILSFVNCTLEDHRRRIKTEVKAKSLLFGGNWINSFLCRTCYFSPGRSKNMMNCTRTIWRLGWIHSFPRIILVQNS